MITYKDVVPVHHLAVLDCRWPMYLCIGWTCCSGFGPTCFVECAVHGLIVALIIMFRYLRASTGLPHSFLQKGYYVTRRM